MNSGLFCVSTLADFIPYPLSFCAISVLLLKETYTLELRSSFAGLANNNCLWMLTSCRFRLIAGFVVENEYTL